MNNLISAFAVPMAMVEMPKPEALNEALRAVFLEYEQKGAEYANPNPFVGRNKALFESRFDLFDWPQPAVRQLADFCMASLYGVIRELNGYDTPTLQKLQAKCESWYHITRQGGYFAAHTHPLHSWSGVYCVRHDGDDPDSQSGRLTFINPNTAAGMYTDFAMAKLKPPFGFAPKSIRLKPGQLVLFPSWILHEVLPYEGTTERITVAFNAKFRYAGNDIDEVLNKR